ncbi:MAG TPA: prenyltransferase [Microscillaceae bacterium]|jgi:4-hydroxybenzoate polyprenyltransferase|nr:prenyltransferase [Microscillaceae bacterium]
MQDKTTKRQIHPFITFAIDFAKLIRLYNLVILVGTQAMLKIFIIDEARYGVQSLADTYFWLLAMATFCIAAAGYVINDYYDVKIDVINKPERVVIGRTIKRRTALIINFTFNFLGLALSMALHYAIGLINLGVIFLLWWYSNNLKRLPLVGNATIAFLSALSVSLAGFYYQKNTPYILMYGLFAFFISLVREIVKDMEDVKGDATFGCRTLPIVWGLRRTKEVVFVFLAIFTTLVLSTFVSFGNIFSVYLGVVLVPAVSIFIYEMARADTKQSFERLSTLCKIMMLLGVSSIPWLGP